MSLTAQTTTAIDIDRQICKILDKAYRKDNWIDRYRQVFKFQMRLRRKTSRVIDKDRYVKNQSDKDRWIRELQWDLDNKDDR